MRSEMRWRLTAFACTISVAALILAMPLDTASAFSKAIWGPVYRNGINQFGIYKKLGVTIDEADLDWADIATRQPRHPTNPNDRAYAWPVEIGQTIAQAKLFHMRVLLQIITTPGWANGGRPSNWAPRHPSDYAAF